MFEVLLMKIANSAERKLEKQERQGKEKGILFVPSNTDLREISEAMFIDGERPSVINQFVLDESRKNKRRDRPVLPPNIIDSLVIEGASEVEIRQVTKDIMSEMKRPILSEYSHSKLIDLSSYEF